MQSINEIKDSKYLDGAMSDPIPIQKALDDGYEKIIVVLTRPENYRKHTHHSHEQQAIIQKSL